MEYNYGQCPECGYVNNNMPDVCPVCGCDLKSHRNNLQTMQKAEQKKQQEEAELARKESEYKEALQLFCSDQHTDALAAFLALGNYKESVRYAEKAKDALYRAAVKAFGENEFLQLLYTSDANPRPDEKEEEIKACAKIYDTRVIYHLILQFESFDHYCDSEKYITACENAKKRCLQIKKELELDEKRAKQFERYNRGQALLNKGAYDEAIKILKKLGNFENAAQLLEQARQLQKELQKKKSETLRKKNIKILAIFSSVIVVIVLAILCVAQSVDRARYSDKNIVLTVVDKVEATEDSRYADGYVTAFKINVENRSTLAVLCVEGKMIIYGPNGEELDSSKCTIKCDLSAGEEGSFVLNLDRRGDAAQKLCYADQADLSATFELDLVKYGNNRIKEYDVEPVSILERDEDSDGTSTIEKAYQDAVALFENQMYLEAMSKFETILDYKDSSDYYYLCYTRLAEADIESKYTSALALIDQEKYGEAFILFNSIIDYKDSEKKIGQIIEMVKTKAEDYANVGDYASAAELLASLGSDGQNSNLYQAYAYASEGNFPEAVECGLTIVVFPEGTEIIPDGYFKGSAHQNELKRVVLPSTVKGIGDAAFYGCAKLTQINLPAGLISIGKNTFSGCTQLTDIQLPDDLLVIGESAFQGAGLKTVHFPNSLQTIGNYAFSGCSALVDVSLPSSLITLGMYAFSDCGGLLSVSIPGNIKTVSMSAFENCERLINVSLADGVEIIGESAFSGCSMLASIELPASLNKIQGSAFYQCTSLSQITVPANVSLIGKNAFTYCQSINAVYFECLEGWYKDGVIPIDVTDPQANATKLTNSSTDSVWKRAE